MPQSQMAGKGQDRGSDTLKVTLFSKPKIKTLGLIDNGMEYFKLGLS